MTREAHDEFAAELARADESLLRTLSGIDRDVAARPSLLPGWDVAHVLAHLVGNALSVVRRLEGVIPAAIEAMRADASDRPVRSLGGKLERELPRLAGRAEPAALLAWITGRGPAPELGRWR